MSDDSYRFRDYSGGCQCGAVRFHATQLHDNPHVCYCRMCQKAFGSLFAPLVGVRREHLTWTRGTPSYFASSAQVHRGFCKDCGTPLFWEYLQGERVSLSIGSFDEPHLIPILYQLGKESRHPSIITIEGAQILGTTEEEDADQIDGILASNHQHPDHDTDAWEVHRD
jgi:hypothetical protein